MIDFVALHGVPVAEESQTNVALKFWVNVDALEPDVTTQGGQVLVGPQASGAGVSSP